MCTYAQKQGVCIGSSLAPILSEVYLSTLDQAVHARLQSFPQGCAIIRRYVDEIFICVFGGPSVDWGVALIKEQARELFFTREDSIGGCLTFLDLKVFSSVGLCWSYGKEAPKPVLAYQSCHPKTVKRGIVFSLFRNALKKSCAHHLEEAFSLQFSRLDS
ncbi:unnamed protein product [Ixodes hexagonus]